MARSQCWVQGERDEYVQGTLTLRIGNVCQCAGAMMTGCGRARDGKEPEVAKKERGKSIEGEGYTYVDSTMFLVHSTWIVDQEMDHRRND